MATMTSSTTKSKTPLSTGQMSDNTYNYCKEKGHMVKDCEKLKKKKEKDAQQGKSTQKKRIRSVALVGKRTTRRRDVGKVQTTTEIPTGTPSFTTKIHYNFNMSWTILNTIIEQSTRTLQLPITRKQER